MGLDTVLGDIAGEARRIQQYGTGNLFTPQPPSREKIVQDIASHIRQAWIEAAKPLLMESERDTLLQLVKDLEARIMASETYNGVAL